MMIPAVGALVIAIAALRSKSRALHDGAASGLQTEAGRIAETEASPFRGIAGIFAVSAFVAVCCLSLFGRSFNLKISVGGNDCSAAFALLMTAAWLPVIAVARRSDHKRPALLYGLLLLLEASYLAIFSCDHAIWLCAALQVNSVLLYLLTTGWSEQASEGLAKKML